jgi:hypothetical protein
MKSPSYRPTWLKVINGGRATRDERVAAATETLFLPRTEELSMYGYGHRPGAPWGYRSSSDEPMGA